MNTNREHSWISERTRSSGSITGPSRVVCNVDNTLISAYVRIIQGARNEEIR